MATLSEKIKDAFGATAALRATYLGFHAGVTSAAWPVGSVFVSVVSTNPATLLGYGTWAAFGAGRVMVGFDSGDTDFDAAEETGGAKTHTLTTAEIPAHTHTYTQPDAPVATALAGVVTTVATRTTSVASGSTGGGGAHNSVQPYIVCYFWKRTA